MLVDLRENSLSAEEIRGVTALGPVRVVSLAGFSGADLQKLQETLRATEDNFAEVRVAVERNETFKEVLGKSGVASSDIVAITRSKDGALTIYTGEPPRYR